MASFHTAEDRRALVERLREAVRLLEVHLVNAVAPFAEW